MQPPIPPLAFIGGGNMATAIIRGGVEAGVLRADRIIVADVVPERRRAMESLGCRAVADGTAALNELTALDGRDSPGALVLAVKPQSLADAAAPLVGELRSRPRLVISILAGSTSERVGSALGGACRVVRAMPNTPARVRRGITALCRGSTATDNDLDRARAMFAAIGETVDIAEELFDAFTAAASSGPAYVFYLAEGMIDGAVRAGFAPEQADAIVRQTIAGAGELLRTDARSTPGELRAAVTSRGGTTAAAVAVLQELGVGEAVARAVVAARDRGRALGG